MAAVQRRARAGGSPGCSSGEWSEERDLMADPSFLRPSPGPAPIDTAVALKQTAFLPSLLRAQPHPERVAEFNERDDWPARAQRTFDVVAASVLLAVAAPMIVTAVLAIKITSPGPALVRRNCVGPNGRLFEQFTLRTTVLDAEGRLANFEHLDSPDGVRFRLTNTPRITRVGHLLCALSIDRAPQLVNVIRGEMSLFGPRPALSPS